jgi:predicted metalloendopeptidase
MNLFSGYDPSGRYYDELGHDKDWWTNVSEANYIAKSECFAKEYSEIPINGSYVDGAETLNENIADNAGLFCKIFCLFFISLTEFL